MMVTGFAVDSGPLELDNGEFQQEVDFLVSLLSLKRDMRVLDAGCGFGRHAMALAQRGIRVDGVERNSFRLDTAIVRAKTLGLHVNWKCMDLTQLELETEYDAAICLYATLGADAPSTHDDQVLRNLAKAIKPHGKIVLDVVNPTPIVQQLQRTNQFLVSSRLPNGDALEQVISWEAGAPTFNVRWSQGSQTANLKYRIENATKWKTRLEQSGFRVVQTFGSLLGHPYRPRSSYRIVILASRLP